MNLFLRNFEIFDGKTFDKVDIVKARIPQVESLINGLFGRYSKEIAIEYNFGSIMQRYEISLVIYNNPDRKNNPYVFMYINTDQYQRLIGKADIKLFSSFSNDKVFDYFMESLKVGFENIPKFSNPPLK